MHDRESSTRPGPGGAIRHIGLVGCGAIGRAVLRAAAEGHLPAPVVGVTSRNADKARDFLATLPGAPPWLPLPDLIERSDLLVEAAGGAVVVPLAQQAFAAGKGLLVVSVNALLAHPEVLAEARRTGCPLLLPTGATAGVDAVKAAAVGGIEYLAITTRKPPSAFADSPYLAQRRIVLDDAAETEVFAGTVAEACRSFPGNLNTSALLSLAGPGPERTRIRVLAVPGLRQNVNTVVLRGAFGEMTVEIRNRPTENPKTSRLPALAIVRALRDAADPVRIGT